VVSIAARYADQVLKQHPRSIPIHLMGFSAGGWFAYAVAAALRKRGATIGALVLLDTGPCVNIHRRFRAVTLVTALMSRLHHHVTPLINQPDGRSRRRYVADRLRSLRGHVHAYARPQQETHPPVEFYGSLLYEYRPPRLPLTVDLFARPARSGFRKHIWRFYAVGGVRVHLMFDEHLDFTRLELMPALAVEIEKALARAEMKSSYQAETNADLPRPRRRCC
jgi:thioesterase domain-containing protein